MNNTTKTAPADAPRHTLRLQGIGLVEGAPVEDVRVGDRLVWNYGGVTEVLVIEPSATFKTFRVTERGGDGVERVRTMRRGRLVAVEGTRSRAERLRTEQAVIELRAEAAKVAPTVTEAQKRTVACPKCKRVAGKPCRMIGTGGAIARDLEIAHRERRASYLEVQAALAPLASAPRPIDLMAQLRQALTGEGIDPRGVEQVAAKIVRDLAPGGIAGPPAKLGPVLPARCDKCIGGVEMVSKALPGDRGPVPLECPKCGRGQVGARLQRGDGATRRSGSDRYPCTVVDILDERHVIVQEDHATRVDDNGNSEVQRWTFATNADAPRVVVTLRKDGWKDASGHRYGLGFRSRYHDFSF